MSVYDVETIHKIKGVEAPLIDEALMAAELALARYHF